MHKGFETVDQYIAEAADNVRPKLKELRRIIREVAPAADERISYQIPGYFQHGYLVYFGGFKNHVSLFGASSGLVRKYQKELKDYKTSKGTIQFRLDHPLPVTLIKKLVRERVRENELRKK